MNHERIDELIKLAQNDDSKLFSQLLMALVHQEKSIVIGASLLLGRLADQRAEPSLLRAFLTTDEEIGTAVAWALGQCGSSLAVPFLETAVQKGFATPNSCEALGHIGNESALPVLINALSSQHPDVRACAARALGNVAMRCSTAQRDEIARKLIPLFYDSSRKVRICAAVILERITQKNESE